MRVEELEVAHLEPVLEACGGNKVLAGVFSPSRTTSGRSSRDGEARTGSPRGIDGMSIAVQSGMHARRVLIVGGVAGGASCAARLRRLDESVEIHLFDRGPHVSFANCGLPYFVGDVIRDEAHLLVASPALFRERFDIA